MFGIAAGAKSRSLKRQTHTTMRLSALDVAFSANATVFHSMVRGRPGPWRSDRPRLFYKLS